MTPNLQQILHSMATTPWAMDAQAFEATLTQIETTRSELHGRWAELAAANEHPLVKMGRERLPSLDVQGGLAEMRVNGTIFNGRADWIDGLFGMVGTDNIADAVTEAGSRGDVRGLLIAYNSPGGDVTGLPELASAITDLAKKKPVFAVTQSVMASGAYWLASSSDRIFASQSANVGSIGVFTVAHDLTGMRERMGVKLEVIKNREAVFKAAGAFGTPLTDDQRAQIQERVQDVFEDFKAAVTAKRQVSEEAMKGQVLRGKVAARHGMIDEIGGRAEARRALGAAIVTKFLHD